MPAPSTGLNLTGLFNLGAYLNSGDPENSSDLVCVLLPKKILIR